MRAERIGAAEDNDGMPLTEEAVLQALTAIRDPDLNRDIVSLKFIKNLRIDGGRVAFSIELTTPACPVKDQMRDQARDAGQPDSRGHRRGDRDDGAGPLVARAGLGQGGGARA